MKIEGKYGRREKGEKKVKARRQSSVQLVRRHRKEGRIDDNKRKNYKER